MQFYTQVKVFLPTPFRARQTRASELVWPRVYHGMAILSNVFDVLPVESHIKGKNSVLKACRADMPDYTVVVNFGKLESIKWSSLTNFC